MGTFLLDINTMVFHQLVWEITGMFQNLSIASWNIQFQGRYFKFLHVCSPSLLSTSWYHCPYFVFRVLNIVSKHWKNHSMHMGKKVHETAFRKIRDHFSFFWPPQIAWDLTLNKGLNPHSAVEVWVLTTACQGSPCAIIF